MILHCNHPGPVLIRHGLSLSSLQCCNFKPSEGLKVEGGNVCVPVDRTNAKDVVCQHPRRFDCKAISVIANTTLRRSNGRESVIERGTAK